MAMNKELPHLKKMWHHGYTSSALFSWNWTVLGSHVFGRALMESCEDQEAWSRNPGPG